MYPDVPIALLFYYAQGRRKAINIGGGGGCHHVLTNIS